MIACRDLAVEVGRFHLQGISFTIETGAYGVLMGRTGCGKTTVLETVCGLKRPRSGSVWLGERNVTHLRAAERGIGYLPQDVALFTTMSVREHLAFALEIRRWGKADQNSRIAELAELLEIEQLLGRRVVGLSGGEAQRVALGRALAASPRFLCLDEPLSALDEEMRGSLCQLLKRVQRETGVTVLHVTHSQVEAEQLADVILSFQHNQIVVVPSGRSESSNVSPTQEKISTI